MEYLGAPSVDRPLPRQLLIEIRFPFIRLSLGILMLILATRACPVVQRSEYPHLRRVMFYAIRDTGILRLCTVSVSRLSHELSQIQSDGRRRVMDG
jgi:hypothetical protein